MKTKVCVIGLGEIGGSVFGELLNHLDKFDLVGVDKDTNKFDRNVAVVEYETDASKVSADVYLIAVWTLEQIQTVLWDIGAHVRNNNALVSIESTIDISKIDALKNTIEQNRMWGNVVHCPHRWNPGDPEHGVFNQERLLGGLSDMATMKGLAFYTQLMTVPLHETTFETAALSKVAENAYRAMEIILAQEIKRSCDAHGHSFHALRTAMNTKWNIDVKEARTGVGGKCLPKDLGIFMKAFPENALARVMYLLNEDFKKSCGILP